MALCAILSLLSLAICCYNFREFRHVCSDRRERRRRNEELTRERELERIRDKHKNDPDLRSKVIQQRIETRICSIENLKDTRRKDSFESTLTERTVVSLNSSDTNSASESNDSSVEDGGVDVENYASNNDENVCTVCLSGFEPGDELAWSKDLRCNHCFHAECLTPWLLKHEECPYCRTPMLENDDFLFVQECTGSDGGKMQSNQNVNQEDFKDDGAKGTTRNEDDDIEAQMIDCSANEGQDFFEIHDGQVIYGREKTGGIGGIVDKSFTVDCK